MKVSETTAFEIDDKAERDALKLRHAALVTEIKLLKETKKAINDSKDEKKEVLQEAKVAEAALKKELGRCQNSAVAMVENTITVESIMEKP